MKYFIMVGIFFQQLFDLKGDFMTIMSEKVYNKTEDLSVSMSHLTEQVKLIERMIAEIACGKITDDKDKTDDHINMLWSLAVGLVEITELREHDVDILLCTIQEEGVV